MKPWNCSKLASQAALIFVCLALAGCAAQRLHDEGLVLIEGGQLESGLEKLGQAAREAPGELHYRAALIVAKQRVVEQLLAQAREAESQGRGEAAEAAYRRALGLDPHHPRAIDGLRQSQRRDVLEELTKQARTALAGGDSEAAARLAGNVLALDPRHAGAEALRTQIEQAQLRETANIPQLRSRLSRPVSLEFRDAPIKMVLDVLARTSGINFLLDKDVKSDVKATIFVRQIAVEDAIELLLVQSQLEKRLINENTIMIYPNTPQKSKEFQDLVIKTFYITNGDVKQTLTMIKTILKTRDIYIDERLNLLVMRDTAEVVRLAEKLIAAQDLAEPEVMLEVEVLEVTRSKLTELGLKYPSQFVAPGGTLEAARNISDARIGVNTGLVLNLKKEDSDTNILASPRIRVRNRERAKVHIGDRVPVVTAVVTPSTGTPITTDAIQYLEVGLKLEVEPTVYRNDEVGIRVGLEVSTFTRLPPSPNGTTPIQVSTRNAATLLRLKDGETQVLMGLVRDDDSRSATRIPLLGDIPLIGRLFSSHLNDVKKTEVVLLITPHVVRNLRQPDDSLMEAWSGTETTFKLRQPFASRSLDAAPAKVSAAVVPPPAAAPLPAPPAETASAPPAAPLVLSWQAPATVHHGSEFAVTLRGRSEDALGTAAFQVRYDPQQLQLVGVMEGDLLGREGGETSFRHTHDEVGGKIAIAQLRVGDAGIRGEGTLATIRFRSLAATTPAQLHLMSVSPLSATGTPLPVQAAGPLSISVQP